MIVPVLILPLPVTTKATVPDVTKLSVMKPFKI